MATPEEKTVRILRPLLSSSGDDADEREATSRAVFRHNQQEVEESGTFLKLVRWEDMAPQIGPGPQQVINEQIGEYDLFVGIMWNRFGNSYRCGRFWDRRRVPCCCKFVAIGAATLDHILFLRQAIELH